MAALVDVTALRIVFGLLGPAADQVVVDCRAAGGAAVRGFPVELGEGVADAQQFFFDDGVAHVLVAVIGAGADRLFLRCGRIIATGGEHQNLFDQAGAGAARCAGLGVLLHLVEREQALFFDGLADRALGDAVATANFVGVGHARGFAHALVTGIAQVAFAEHQLVADVVHRAAFAQQLEVPGAIDRVAVEAGADQLVVFDDQFFVDPARRVAHHDLFAAFAAHEVAGGE